MMSIDFVFGDTRLRCDISLIFFFTMKLEKNPEMFTESLNARQISGVAQSWSDDFSYS